MKDLVMMALRVWVDSVAVTAKRTLLSVTEQRTVIDREVFPGLALGGSENDLVPQSSSLRTCYAQ